MTDRWWWVGVGRVVLPATVHKAADVVKFLCLDNGERIDVAPTVTASQRRRLAFS